LGIASPEIRHRVDKALEQVGMSKYALHAPHLLSGGQKQRIAIARALILDPEILILDDSVSAVDTDTEEKILQHLRETRKGKTNIIIAHRISTIQDADKIIVIDGGTIAEMGTHDQLVEQGGIYADMYNRQLLEKMKKEEYAL
ncbi:MAG: ATP-binding cassette domain-containing protein, partial [Clostridia bacterium]|nr:ATP-binding cassette domain-containing protein [Clostridia bacterium]